VIVLIDLEHERLRSEPSLRRYFAAKTLETKYRLEDISGEHCLILDYRRASPSTLDELDPLAVVVGGNYTGFQHFTKKDLAGLERVFMTKARPMLAVCGGFQLMARVHGGRLGAMGSDRTPSGREPRDTDTPLPPELDSGARPTEGPEADCERGFLPVRVVRPHPLFDGFPTHAVVYQLHGGEVKQPPDEFTVIAGSERCRIQAVVHSSAPVYGVQFHPECYDDTHPDGRRLLANFFRLARGAASQMIRETGGEAGSS
jgi:GMP synthase-like glutamine amidotransferase